MAGIIEELRNAAGTNNSVLIDPSRYRELGLPIPKFDPGREDATEVLKRAGVIFHELIPNQTS